MNKLQIFQYNDNPVSFRNKDGIIYVNATEMAKPFGKRPVDYLRLPNTIQLMNELTEVGKSHNGGSLVLTERGGATGGGATWFHEDLAIDYAQWLNIKFRVWCLERIKELGRYGVTTVKTFESMSIEEMMIHQLQQRIEDKKRVDAIENRIEQIEARTATTPDYFTVVGYACLNGIPCNLKFASLAGKKASKICKEQGIPIDQIHDPRFGKIGCYPTSVLRIVFEAPI